MKEKKQLMSSIHELEGKINFIKRYDIAELSPEHREKTLNAIRVCNLTINLILKKNNHKKTIAQNVNLMEGDKFSG